MSVREELLSRLWNRAESPFFWSTTFGTNPPKVRTYSSQSDCDPVISYLCSTSGVVYLHLSMTDNRK